MPSPVGIQNAAAGIHTLDKVTGVFKQVSVSLFTRLQGLLRPRAVPDFGGQGLVGLGKICRPFLDSILQVLPLGLGLAADRPFSGKRVCQLDGFDIVERLLENDQAIGMAEVSDNIRPGIVRVCGADNDLQVRVGFPEVQNGLYSVPSWRHSDVHESQGIGTVLGNRSTHHGQAVLALISRIDFETHAADLRLLEQQLFVPLKIGRSAVFSDEDLAQIVVDGLVVVDDQYPVRQIIGVACNHTVCVSVAVSLVLTGSSKVKVAPRPRPSLSAQSTPPMRCAALAPECRPKPWPSRRVVNP